MTHPPFNVPVPCPVCNGTGIYYDTDFRGRVRENGCIACHGSCVMYLTEQQYAKRIGDADGYTTSRTYTTQEIKIITKAKTARVAFRLINEAGYTDRCFHQVRKYRDRLAAKRKKRLHTDKTTIDITQSKTDIRNTEPKEDPK